MGPHLGGLASGLGPPQRGGLRRDRRVGRRCVRRRCRVEGERIRGAALTGAVLAVAGDGGEVHAEAGAQRPLGLPPYPLHCSLSGTLAAADSCELEPFDCWKNESGTTRGRLRGRWGWGGGGAEGKAGFEGEAEPPLQSGGGGGLGWVAAGLRLLV